MNNVEQEFEAWKLTLPKCGGYGTGCNGDLEGMNHQPDCPMFGKQFATHLDAWRAAYEAGEIAMKEKAAKICDAGFEECTSRPNCHSLDAELIRKLPLSGAEEATKTRG